MKKFRFRMEPLLELKAHIEKEKQKVLATAALKVQKQENQLSIINDNRVKTQTSHRSHLTGSLNKAFLSTFSRYYVRLRKDELTGRELLKALARDKEGKRLQLIQATKEKKSFEKLRERLKTKYNEEANLYFQKEQDEIASQMFMYKKRLPD